MRPDGSTTFPHLTSASQIASPLAPSSLLFCVSSGGHALQMPRFGASIGSDQARVSFRDQGPVAGAVHRGHFRKWRNSNGGVGSRLRTAVSRLLTPVDLAHCQRVEMTPLTSAAARTGGPTGSRENFSFTPGEAIFELRNKELWTVRPLER